MAYLLHIPEASRKIILAHRKSQSGLHDSCISVYSPGSTYLQMFVCFRNIALLTSRQRLDRRRVEDAFFRVAAWYPDVFLVSHLHLHSSTLRSISRIVPLYHDAFMQLYASMYSNSVVHSEGIAHC